MNNKELDLLIKDFERKLVDIFELSYQILNEFYSRRNADIKEKKLSVNIKNKS